MRTVTVETLIKNFADVMRQFGKDKFKQENPKKWEAFVSDFLGKIIEKATTCYKGRLETAKRNENFEADIIYLEFKNFTAPAQEAALPESIVAFSNDLQLRFLVRIHIEAVDTNKLFGQLKRIRDNVAQMQRDGRLAALLAGKQAGTEAYKAVMDQLLDEGIYKTVVPVEKPIVRSPALQQQVAPVETVYSPSPFKPESIAAASATPSNELPSGATKKQPEKQSAPVDGPVMFGDRKKDRAGVNTIRTRFQELINQTAKDQAASVRPVPKK